MPEMEGLDRLLEEHPFFHGMEPAVRKVVAGCAANERYAAGELVFREDGPADRFYLIRHGTVSIEVALPGRERLVVQTLHDGDIMGWAWLVPPYRWTTDARATSDTRLVSLDGKCLRGKCESDHSLGYAMHTRFLPVVAERLAATRLQLIDMYAAASQAGTGAADSAPED